MISLTMNYVQATSCHECCSGTFQLASLHAKCDHFRAAQSVPQILTWMSTQIGAVTNTFGVPGVDEHCFYMKNAEDAKALRERINACFELANLPNTTDEERRRLLTFVIVSSCRLCPGLPANDTCLRHAVFSTSLCCCTRAVFAIHTAHTHRRFPDFPCSGRWVEDLQAQS